MRLSHRLVLCLLSLALFHACAASAPPTRTHVLLINGGQDENSNFLSHVEHIEGWLALLPERGIDEMTLFASDGEAAEADLIVSASDATHPLSWMLANTKLWAALSPQAYRTSTDWSPHAITARPARRVDVLTWLAESAQTLEAGDELLIYVTDHGGKGVPDLDNGTIALWDKDSLDVHDLRGALTHFAPGVRVRMVMSQCFSGTFAASFLDDDVPTGDVCGFFAVPRTRPAYGCYAEGRAGGVQGHGYLFTDTLRETGSLELAHRRTLLLDNTPDVPVRSSDIYAAHVLANIAEARATTPAALVDDILRTQRALDQPLPVDHQLNAISQSLGLPSQRWTMDALRRTEGDLNRLQARLKKQYQPWQQLAQQQVERLMFGFLDAHPHWRTQLETLDQLDDDARLNVRDALLQDFLTHLGGEDALPAFGLKWTQAQRIRADKASWRMEIRKAGIARLRVVLETFATDHLLANNPTLHTERDALARLRTCEMHPLPSTGDIKPVPAPPAPEPLPPLAEDRALANTLDMPLLGIQFLPAEHIEGGAVVTYVAPHSVAERAGLQVNDVILGDVHATFRHAQDLRFWVVVNARSDAAPLVVLRDQSRLNVPVRW